MLYELTYELEEVRPWQGNTRGKALPWLPLSCQ